jgi:quercetin dioxygenase-like cupin family protein
MSAFQHLSALQIVPIWTGVIARRVEGRHVTFAVVELEPNSLVAEHRHPNEQVGIIVKGRLRFKVGAEVRDLREGDTYVIPGGVPHEALAGPDGAVAIDVFSPVRGDWSRFTPEAPRPALKWP